MSDTAAPLAVTVRELGAVHAVCRDCALDPAQVGFNTDIRDTFQRLQALVRELGYDPFRLLTIGALPTGAPPTTYSCCMQVPGTVQAGGEGMVVRDLPGGRYAVLAIDKDPAIIGPSIGRFYQEYLPQHGLVLDVSRPTYEVYYERTMEYCVPLR